MTEEIIIDGVNVSGCCFYNDGKCSNPNGMACNCINNAVCYFKELKRLEFELKVTKADYEASEQENKELKEENIEYDEELAIEKLSHKSDLETLERYRSALEEIKQMILNHSDARISPANCLLDISSKINKTLYN